MPPLKQGEDTLKLLLDTNPHPKADGSTSPETNSPRSEKNNGENDH